MKKDYLGEIYDETMSPIISDLINKGLSEEEILNELSIEKQSASMFALIQKSAEDSLRTIKIICMKLHTKNKQKLMNLFRDKGKFGELD